MSFFKKIFGSDTPQSNSEQQTVRLEITGMTCDHCATGIEKMLEGKSGIFTQKVDYRTGIGTVVIDENRTTPETVANIINGSKNYRAQLLAANGNRKQGNQFDLIIIGGGSAAFSAAIKAEELGLSALMVNGGLPFGGTCVNVGCVPSKNLIRAAETVRHASHSNFAGIRPKDADIDFQKIIQDKKALVATMQQKKYMDVVEGFQYLKMVEGWARFEDEKTIVVNDKDRYTALKFIIATGATTNIPHIEGLKEVGYLTNISLFDLEKQPESLTIMGAGYIGLEIAMAYNRLGTKVRIIEFTDRVLRTQTPDISEELEKQMRSENIEILPNFRAIKFEKLGNHTIIHCKCADGSATQILEPGSIVVASGTRPNTQNMGLENIGLRLAKSGHIEVNAKMETNLPNIYAIGDVTNTPAFVYTAAYEGKIAVENAFAAAGSEDNAPY